MQYPLLVNDNAHHETDQPHLSERHLRQWGTPYGGFACDIEGSSSGSRKPEKTWAAARRTD